MRPPEGTHLPVGNCDLWVGRELGSGGEGVVLALVDATGAAQLALKWYKNPEPWRKVLLETLIHSGPPSDRYVWPVQMIYGPDDSFGYVMALIPDVYMPISKVLHGTTDLDPTRSQKYTFALDTAQSFFSLHLKGLCYRDVNWNNALVDARTGRALICDNDNVGIDGRSESKVQGFPEFMAPEVIRGEVMPSRATDQHSLAVMLFYLFLVAHPLDGTHTNTWHGPWDMHAKRHFYGENPIFMLDPSGRNSPDPDEDAHVPQYWQALAPELRELFVRAFNEGLYDRDARVQDSEWCDALVRARGRLWRCGACTAESHVGVNGQRCTGCGRAVTRTLRVNGYSLAVSDLLEVTHNHLSHGYDDPTVLGVAESHPSEAGVIGLRNDSGSAWRAWSQRGSLADVHPGRRVRLDPGVRIDFGEAQGVVEPI